MSLDTVMSSKEAEKEFQSLVQAYQIRALWFMDSTQMVELKSPTTLSVINSIAEKCSRAEWVKLKKIKKWLLQNSR